MKRRTFNKLLLGALAAPVLPSLANAEALQGVSKPKPKEKEVEYCDVEVRTLVQGGNYINPAMDASQLSEELVELMRILDDADVPMKGRTLWIDGEYHGDYLETIHDVELVRGDRLQTPFTYWYGYYDYVVQRVIEPGKYIVKKIS